MQMSSIFTVVAFVLLRSSACVCSDGTGVQDCDSAESDVTALLALGSQLKKAPVAEDYATNKRAFSSSVEAVVKSTNVEKLAWLTASSQTNPIKTLEMLSEMLQLTAASAEGVEPQNGAKRRASLLAGDASTKACRRRTHYSKPLPNQPPYPFEPLLDVDFVYNAGNWLDQWMAEQITKNSTVPVAKTAGATKTLAPTTAASNANSSLFQSACFTHDFAGASAKPGTKCLFGVDSEDEGYHCIYENGRYGSFGWCWTDHDKQKWGSCSQNCPVMGPTKVLVKKIAALESKIKTILQRLRARGA